MHNTKLLKSTLWAVMASCIAIVVMALSSCSGKSQDSTTDNQSTTASTPAPPSSTDAEEVMVAAYTSGDEYRAYTITDWDSFTDEQRAAVTPVGVQLWSNGHRFVVALKDAGDGGKFKWENKVNVNECVDIPTVTNYPHGPEQMNDYYGRTNTENIVKFGTEYGRDFPAAKAASSYNGGPGKWYLPGHGESWLMHQNLKAINYVLKEIGGEPLSEDVYWTSTENSSFYAGFMMYFSGSTPIYNKIAELKVRAAAPAGEIPNGDQTPAKFVVPIKQQVGTINGHEYVDLGLKSGLKWASCNVGATTPSAKGDYFSWGETTAKSTYDNNNTSTCGKSISQLRSSGIISSSGTLNKEYDAASVNWGSSWRMPTKGEIDELILMCKWEWTTDGDQTGYKVTGPNGSYIFIPTAGYWEGSSLLKSNTIGCYWSSSVHSDNLTYFLCFSKGNRYAGWDSRFRGLSVRPVAD